MSCDPLSYLGSDIFTNVLWFLSVRDLARAECVSAGWAKLSKSSRRLWRTLCIEAKVMQQDLVPARFWDVPTYQSPLTECDWRTSCLKALSVAKTMETGRFTSYEINWDRYGKWKMIPERGDRRILAAQVHTCSCNLALVDTVEAPELIHDSDESHHDHTVIQANDRKTGRVLWRQFLPSVDGQEIIVECGYMLQYECRDFEMEGLNPRLWRTYSLVARSRRGYCKATPPPNGRFGYMCAIPEFRNALSLQLRVDREEEADAEAILIALHHGLVRICHIEQDMWMERIPLNPDYHTHTIAVDDNYVFVSGFDLHFPYRKHFLHIYSRATGQLAVVLPDYCVPPMRSGDFEHHRNRYEYNVVKTEMSDDSRPARWGPIPSSTSSILAQPIPYSKRYLRSRPPNECRCWGSESLDQSQENETEENAEEDDGEDDIPADHNEPQHVDNNVHHSQEFLGANDTANTNGSGDGPQAPPSNQGEDDREASPGSAAPEQADSNSHVMPDNGSEHENVEDAGNDAENEDFFDEFGDEDEEEEPELRWFAGVLENIYLQGDTLVLGQCCDVLVWRDYRNALGRILRTVQSPIQRGHWIASLMSLSLRGVPEDALCFDECHPLGAKGTHIMGSTIFFESVLKYDYNQNSRYLFSINIADLPVKGSRNIDTPLRVRYLGRRGHDEQTGFLQTTSNQLIWQGDDFDWYDNYYGGRAHVFNFALNDAWGPSNPERIFKASKELWAGERGYR